MVTLRKLSNCCAFASLKTGTLVIGALNLVVAVILTIASIWVMAESKVGSAIIPQKLKCLHLIIYQINLQTNGCEGLPKRPEIPFFLVKYKKLNE